jgi:hypothetical protein
MEACAIPTVDCPPNCRKNYAVIDYQIMQAYQDAEDDVDHEQLERVLRWDLMLPAILFRRKKSTRKKGGKTRNVSGRIQLWKDGEKEQLITECREETQAYLKAQLTRQPKKRTAEQAEDDRVRQALELSHCGKQGKAARKVLQCGVGNLSDSQIEKQMEDKHPQRADVGGVKKMEAYVRVDQLPEHERLDLRLAFRREDTHGQRCWAERDEGATSAVHIRRVPGVRRREHHADLHVNHARTQPSTFAHAPAF